MDKVKTFLTQLYDTFVVPIKDYRVLGWTILVGLVASIIDPQGLRVIGMVLYVMFYWLLALSVRKIFFPYRFTDKNGVRKHLKLSDFFKASLEGNTAAAIALASVIFFMCAVAHSFMNWMR